MRQPRLKLDSRIGQAYYHCISRVVDRRFIFGSNEKEQFVHWMYAYAQFCGLHILTYCIMSNHFHILVEVPQRPAVLPNDEELLRLYAVVHGEIHRARPFVLTCLLFLPNFRACASPV